MNVCHMCILSASAIALVGMLSTRSQCNPAQEVQSTVNVGEPRSLSVNLAVNGPVAGQAFTIPGMQLTLLSIPAGSFTMGSTNTEWEDEQPQTKVTISRAFWLGKYEVTQSEWSVVMGTEPSHYKGSRRPVEQLSLIHISEPTRPY